MCKTSYRGKLFLIAVYLAQLWLQLTCRKTSFTLPMLATREELWLAKACLIYHKNSWMKEAVRQHNPLKSSFLHQRVTTSPTCKTKPTASWIITKVKLTIPMRKHSWFRQFRGNTLWHLQNHLKSSARPEFGFSIRLTQVLPCHAPLVTSLLRKLELLQSLRSAHSPMTRSRTTLNFET